MGLEMLFHQKKKNICPVCKEPCKGKYIEGAVVTHMSCAMKSTEKIREELTKTWEEHEQRKAAKRNSKL